MMPKLLLTWLFKNLPCFRWLTFHNDSEFLTLGPAVASKEQSRWGDILMKGPSMRIYNLNLQLESTTWIYNLNLQLESATWIYTLWFWHDKASRSMYFTWIFWTTMCPIFGKFGRNLLDLCAVWLIVGGATHSSHLFQPIEFRIWFDIDLYFPFT